MRGFGDIGFKAVALRLSNELFKLQERCCRDSTSRLGFERFRVWSLGFFGCMYGAFRCWFRASALGRG